jgi:hypothetical protein
MDKMSFFEKKAFAILASPSTSGLLQVPSRVKKPGGTQPHIKRIVMEIQVLKFLQHFAVLSMHHILPKKYPQCFKAHLFA